jgi:hypothetical protein
VPAFFAFAQEFYRWVDDQGAIHFSDNLYSIPEKFRAQAEKRFQPAVRAPSGSVPEYQPRGSQPAVIVVPFKRQGNLIIVDGTINQTVPVRFILDTGAEISIIPLSVAPRLGINPRSAIFITMTGIGGSVEVPLVEVESLSIGGAEVRNLEVTLNNTPLPDTGLLGADFLSDYKVDIKYAANQIFLEPVERPYGGHTFEWWQKKFRMYLAIKRQYETARAKAGPSAANDALESQLRAVDQKISELEGRASQAGIPREFRQ